MGEWLQDRFSDRNYLFVTAEFGTYHPIRVLALKYLLRESGAYPELLNRLQETTQLFSALLKPLDCANGLHVRFDKRLVVTG